MSTRRCRPDDVIASFVDANLRHPRSGAIDGYISPMGGLRVAIIDDDEWVRRGRLDGLGSIPEIDSLIGAPHREAIAWTSEWDGFDVVVLDAHDIDADWDRFTGVAIASAIRRRRTSEQTRIVVVTGHAGNELLRLRMAEAGADLFYAHDDVRSVESLFAAIDAARSADAPARTVGVNEALSMIQQGGYAPAFTPGIGQKNLPFTRRQLITLRSRVARLLGRPQPPPWRDVVDTVNRARGVYGPSGSGETEQGP
jgi:DNA-binding NarL/FixJ family response regulator